MSLLSDNGHARSAAGQSGRDHNRAKQNDTNNHRLGHSSGAIYYILTLMMIYLVLRLRTHTVRGRTNFLAPSLVIFLKYPDLIALLIHFLPAKEKEVYHWFISWQEPKSTATLSNDKSVAQGVRYRKINSTLKCRSCHLHHPSEIYRDDVSLKRPWLCK